MKVYLFLLLSITMAFFTSCDDNDGSSDSIYGDYNVDQLYTWLSTSECALSQNYTLTLKKGNGADDVILDNFAAYFDGLKGTLDDDGTRITIVDQIGIADHGPGNLWDITTITFLINNPGSIEFTFTLSDENYIDLCGPGDFTASGSK